VLQTGGKTDVNPVRSGKSDRFATKRSGERNNREWRTRINGKFVSLEEWRDFCKDPFQGRTDPCSEERVVSEVWWLSQRGARVNTKRTIYLGKKIATWTNSRGKESSKEINRGEGGGFVLLGKNNNKKLRGEAIPGETSRMEGRGKDIPIR